MKRILAIVAVAMIALLVAVVILIAIRPADVSEPREMPMPFAPTVTYDEAFVASPVAASASPVAATPVALRANVTDCEQSACVGADPEANGCADPERGAYIQASTEVRDEQGNLLGTLTLRGNYLGCGGVMWASFADLSGPLTFEIRVVEHRTGFATEPLRITESDKDATSPMLNSPLDGRMRAEVVVFDEDGEVIAEAVTD